MHGLALFSSSPATSTLSGSSAVGSTAISTTTNTAHGKTKKEKVGIEMVDKTLSPPAQYITTAGAQGHMYEDIPSVAPHMIDVSYYEDMSPSGEQ